MASASWAGPLPPLGSSPRAGASPFEAGRAVVAELPAGVERFAFASSVDDPNDTSLRTPAAGVHLSTARLVFGRFGQRVHRAPFHEFETLPAGRFATTGQGRRTPVRLLRMVASKPGARRERSRDAPLRGGGSASGSASFHLSRPGTAMYWPLPAWRCCRRLFTQCLENGQLLSRGTMATEWPY